MAPYRRQREHVPGHRVGRFAFQPVAIDPDGFAAAPEHVQRGAEQDARLRVRVVEGESRF
ncbi:hypothetical protein [Rhodanobacter lindaniclasticus]